MRFKVNKKEYNIFFAFEPTLKARILSRMAKMSVEISNSENQLEKIEDMLLFLPEVILVGLQKHHSDEFGYNLDTKEGFEEQKSKAFSLASEYFDTGKVDCVEFFNQLQEEMTREGFLRKTFEKEVEKAKEEQKVIETDEETNS